MLKEKRTMRVLAWNIRQGGGRRRQAAIAEYVRSVDADVVVISEYNPEVRDDLAQRLADRYVAVDHPAGFGSGHTNVLVLTAGEHSLRDELAPWTGPDAHRLVHVEVAGWHIIGCYIPGKASGQRKLDFWRHLVEVAGPTMKDLPAVIVGDLNTGLHEIDEPGRDFVCADDMARLYESGWRDAWAECQPGVRPPGTWWSHVGNPFRLDHAILSPAAPKGATVRYDQQVAGIGHPGFGWRNLSDHAALILDLPAAPTG